MANFVGKYVELCLVEGMVGSSFVFGGGLEFFDFGFGWVDIVSFKVCFDGNGELFLGDLSVIVGINLFEDFVGLSLGDAWFFCR